MPTILKEVLMTSFFIVKKRRELPQGGALSSSSEERAEAVGADVGQFRNAVNSERLKTVSSCPPFKKKS